MSQSYQHWGLIGWIKQYREALAPVIRQAAEDHKIKIVFTESD
jgi:hypothetical protein